MSTSKYRGGIVALSRPSSPPWRSEFPKPLSVNGPASAGSLRYSRPGRGGYDLDELHVTAANEA